jgi:hypothetical protein
MIIKAIIFKRTRICKKESGIMIESDGDSNDLIIDSDGDIIPVNIGNPSVYTIQESLPDLCIDIKPILKNINEYLNE